MPGIFAAILACVIVFLFIIITIWVLWWGNGWTEGRGAMKTSLKSKLQARLVVKQWKTLSLLPSNGAWVNMAFIHSQKGRVRVFFFAALLGLVDAKREKLAGRKMTLIRWSVLGAVLSRAYLEKDGAIQNAIKERQGESSVH